MKEDSDRPATESGLARKLLTQAGLFALCLVFSLLFFYEVVFTKTGTFLAQPDNSIQSFAWMTKTVTAWRALDPPLWDFRVMSGTSFVGELQTAPFYPLNILFAWTTRPGSQHALDVYIVLHFALASYFMLTLLRANRLSVAAAAAGALIYAYVGTIAQRASGQSNIFMGLVYLPLIAFFFQKGLSAARPLLKNRWLYLSGVALAFAMLAGHMQPYVHSAMALSFLAVFLCYRSDACTPRRALAALAFVGVVSLMLSSIQLIPSVEYLSRSYRWIGADSPIKGLAKTPYEVYAFHEVLAVSQLRSFFKPMYDIRDGATLFVSLAGLALALVGCLALTRLSWFAFGLALFSVLMALGGHTLVGRLSWYVPVVNNVREPIRMLFLYHFAMSILAALGAQLIATRLTRNRLGQALICAALVGLILLQVFPMGRRLYVPNAGQLAPENLYARNEVINYLESRMTGEGQIYRMIDNEEALPQNIGDVYAIPGTSSHRATMYGPYYEYLSRDWSMASPNFDRLGAKYIVSRTPLKDFSEIMNADGLILYERPHPLPVFQLLDGNSERKPAQVSSVRWSQNSVSFNLANPEPGYLVFAQPYYPGWKAYVDGSRRAVRRADIFTAVALDGTEKEVRFVYSPDYLWACELAILLVLAGLAYSLVWGRAQVVRATRDQEEKSAARL